MEDIDDLTMTDKFLVCLPLKLHPTLKFLFLDVSLVSRDTDLSNIS